MFPCNPRDSFKSGDSAALLIFRTADL
uniref:Uncharacterized protein n=1 Tax=Anguilla anguilla TaxID=7936 RepID=A0A0E9R5K0_ANGAN